MTISLSILRWRPIKPDQFVAQLLEFQEDAARNDMELKMGSFSSGDDGDDGYPNVLIWHLPVHDGSGDTRFTPVLALFRGSKGQALTFLHV